MMAYLSNLDEIGPPCTGLKARLGLSSLAESELHPGSDLIYKLRIAKSRLPVCQARK